MTQIEIPCTRRRQRPVDFVLWYGDCLALMADIPDHSIDMILCDLPYGTTNCHWDTVIPFEPLWAHYKRIIKKNGAVVLFGAEPFSSHLRLSNITWYRYDWVWDKKSTTGFLNAKKRPLVRHEMIHVFAAGSMSYFPEKEVRGAPRVKGGCKVRSVVYNKFETKQSVNNEYYPTSILSFSNANQKDKQHPTQKPVDLLEYLIKTYTLEGETVLDNCMGSGSTGVACKNTGRRFIGIEQDES